MNRLWTKNYTIITIGSVVSMLGNSMAGFAMSLFVLDYTQSPLYYAIYMVLRRENLSINGPASTGAAIWGRVYRNIYMA